MMRNSRFTSIPRHLQFVSAAAVLLLAGFLTIGYAPPAEALPSYARQTGQPCGTCHTDFAGLTPYGRLFKIQGYTTGGGPYRTTLFPGSGDSDRNSLCAADLGKSGPSSGNSDQSDQKTWVPPISMMAIVGFTNTQAPLPPPTAPYNPNNNVVVSPVSFFWGGAITDHIGAFAQVTYNAPPAGRVWHRSIRRTYVDVGQYRRPLCRTRRGSAAFNVTYGITANNNPTVQDPWNTTPAWAFPYAVSTLWATDSDPTPIIDGAFAAHVASVGAYAFINDALYLEAIGLHHA